MHPGGLVLDTATDGGTALAGDVLHNAVTSQ
jgi:hypothetical protein